MSKLLDGLALAASTGAMNSTFDGLSLSAAFRHRTSLLHAQAEKSGIVQDLLAGKVSVEGHVLLIRNLLPAYETLEAALEARRMQSEFTEFTRPEVYRAEAIKTDLTAICGADWPESLPLLAPGLAYAERIAQMARQGKGHGLIAHAYVRYLGDLSGGQILKTVLKRSLGLKSGALNFYEFPGIPDLDSFKVAYRAAIDDAAGHIVNRDAVIEESAWAFALNIQVSRSVKAAVAPDTAAA